MKHKETPPSSFPSLIIDDPHAGYEVKHQFHADNFRCLTAKLFD